jgi:subtilisin family serine protease
MKKHIVYLILLMLSIYGYGQTDYYWYKGQKQILQRDSSKTFVLFDSLYSVNDLARGLKTDTSKIKKPNLIKLSKSVTPYSKSNIQTEQPHKYWSIISNGKSRLNTSMMKGVLYEAPFFKGKNGKDAGLSNLFYVKLRKNEDIKILDSLAQENGIKILGTNKFMPLWCTLSCDKNSKGNSLQMANVLYESGLFDAAEPDFIQDWSLQTPLEQQKKYSVTTNNPVLAPPTNDTYYSNQWHLSNTGQYGGTVGNDDHAEAAWTISQGNPNIIIGVLDAGIQLDHPDLAANISPISFNTETGTSPSEVLANHATCVAGIIAAISNNNLGVSGIAPSCTLMSISNGFYNYDESQNLSDGINFAWQNGASVINNSWGGGLQSQFIDDAISGAITNGRNGLGTVVVFSAGNDNLSPVSYPSSNVNTLSVGAVSECNQRKNPSSCDQEGWGSNFGPGLDVTAPGVLISTTDRTGGDGYNSGSTPTSSPRVPTDYSNADYTNIFNGTSSAAPQVSGLAGLILSVNPNLTWQQVKNIIQSTTDKIGNYSYTLGSGEDPNLAWNNEMGYGRINAYNALLQAQSGGCTITYSNQTVSSNTNVSGCIITSSNVIVNSGILTMTATNYTTISPVFTVNSGAALTLQ